MQVKISDRNSKIGKIPNVSLTPVKSCSNCRECSKDCYALKSYKQYPNVRKAWDNNLFEAVNNSKQYFADINTYLFRHAPRMFRWHVAGDIPNQEYFDSMKSIANKHPNTKFLAFTKSYHLKFRDIPKNLSIVMSVWPGMPLPKQRLPKAYMQDGTETRVRNAIECHGKCDTCGMCWELRSLGKNVVFHKH